MFLTPKEFTILLMFSLKTGRKMEMEYSNSSFPRWHSSKNPPANAGNGCPEKEMTTHPIFLLWKFHEQIEFWVGHSSWQASDALTPNSED